MNYFVIVPTEQVSQEMVNLSTSRNVDEMRKVGVNSVIETASPTHPAFYGFPRYDHAGIMFVLAQPEPDFTLWDRIIGWFY